MKRTHQFLVALGLVATSAPAFAERAPEPKDGAALVVVGEVQAVFGRDRSGGVFSETYTDFVVQIKVEAVQKGQGAKPGDTLHAHCVQRTRSAVVPMPGMAGHNLIPKPGWRIRAYLNDRSGVYEFVYPDGLDSLNGEAAGRIVEAPMGGSWWGYAGAFLLGVAAAVLALIWRGRRSNRRPAAIEVPPVG